MKAQEPAVGILKQGDYGFSKCYYIQCDCGNDDCSHSIDIEANEFSIDLTIYHKVSTRWRDANRWKQLWQILTRGYYEAHTFTVLTEQTATNYAATLMQAVEEVKNFKKAKK